MSLGFDPTPLIEGREELRRELGYHPDERVVDRDRRWLRRRRGAPAPGHRQLPGRGASGQRAADDRRRRAADRPRLAGAPRTASRSGPSSPSSTEHLAACDLAVVQGGLTTTMELAAARRPFLYFPLRNHFEQNRHVRHRLERYGAGRYMDYATSAAGGHRRGDRRRDRPAGRLPAGRDRRRGARGRPHRAPDLGRLARRRCPCRRRRARAWRPDDEDDDGSDAQRQIDDRAGPDSHTASGGCYLSR